MPSEWYERVVSLSSTPEWYERVVSQSGKYKQVDHRGKRRGMLYGDKGAIEVVNINNCEEIILTLNDGTRRVIKRPEQITGFEYQVLSVAHAIAEDKTECLEMPHADIIAIMEQMDSLRKEWGIHYGTIEEA